MQDPISRHTAVTLLAGPVHAMRAGGCCSCQAAEGQKPNSGSHTKPFSQQDAEQSITQQVVVSHAGY